MLTTENLLLSLITVERIMLNTCIGERLAKLRTEVLLTHIVCSRLNRDVVTESPKPRRLVPAPPLQRFRRRPITADDNKHGGHVTDAKLLPVIVEQPSASSAAVSRRTETLLDAMHKKYYPDQYGVATTGSDVRTTRGDLARFRAMRTDDGADYTSATLTASIVGDSPDGATGRVSPHHVTGNPEIYIHQFIHHKWYTKRNKYKINRDKEEKLN